MMAALLAWLEPYKPLLDLILTLVIVARRSSLPSSNTGSRRFMSGANSGPEDGRL